MNPDTRTQGEAKEGPEITQEESIPSDGKDELGAELMKDVRNEKMQNGDTSKS